MTTYKHIHEDDCHLLRSYCKEYFPNINDEKQERLLDFLELLLEKNQMVNLTAVKESHKAVILHLIDSLLFLKATPDNCKSLLDMGSGGGLPGIPIGIVANIQITSLDSVKKKIAAQQEFVKELGLNNFTFSSERIEELPIKNKTRYQVITARALASLPVLIEYATPLLQKGGTLVVSKGNLEQEEIDSGKKVASICGLNLIETVTFELPDNMGHRELLIYEKVRDSKIKLPRQVGMAKKMPLG